MYEKALASYEQALEIDPGNSNAHVARGAAYANKVAGWMPDDHKVTLLAVQQLLESAIHEFDLALKAEPGMSLFVYCVCFVPSFMDRCGCLTEHVNAVKYKEATQAKLAAQYQADEESKAKVNAMTTRKHS